MYRKKPNKVWSSFQHGFGRTLGAFAANMLIKNPGVAVLLLVVVAFMLFVAFSGALVR